MQLALLGDTHGTLPTIPDGADLVLLAGDILPNGSLAQQDAWVNATLTPWLKQSPCPVVAVAGNHDHLFAETDIATRLPWHYLCDTGITIQGITIYGIPWTPGSTDHGFHKTEATVKSSLDRIPPHLDILLLHSGPRGMGDILDHDGWAQVNNQGYESLVDRLRHTKPRMVVFGHNHSCRGIWRWPETLFVNCTSGFNGSHEGMGGLSNKPFAWHTTSWPIPQTPTNADIDVALQIPGHYSYVRVGIGTRTMTLSDTGTITEGHAGCERQWRVRWTHRKQKPTLIISGDREDTMFLTQDDDGVWRGHWEHHERNAVELRRIMKSPSWEFGGGLGDIIYQCYEGGSYHLLDDISQPTDITLICHNPFATELFSWHPKRHLIQIRSLPWWPPHEDENWRDIFGIPPHKPNPQGGRPGMTFHLAQSDREELARLPTRFVVVAQAAGEPHRSLPPAIMDVILTQLRELGIVAVLVGRSYERNGRTEPYADYQAEGVINLINKLTVPGTCELVRRSHAIVTCHSAMNIVGWWERRPTLLLYPETVRQFHFLKTDRWSFGQHFPENFMATLEDGPGVHAAITNFLTYLRTTLQEPSSHAVPVRPYPEEARQIPLHWPDGRFTSAQDVQLLLHEARQVPGDILEVGCHRGVTTLELSHAFADRLIWAVDAPYAAVCPQQAWERVAWHEHCEFARTCRNVIPVLKTIESLPPGIPANLGVVFLDGGISYHELRRDTEIALALLRPQGGLIAWHDCYDDSPAWVGVKSVIAQRHEANPGNVWRVADSWMAFERVPPTPS